MSSRDVYRLEDKDYGKTRKLWEEIFWIIIMNTVPGII